MKTKPTPDTLPKKFEDDYNPKHPFEKIIIGNGFSFLTGMWATFAFAGFYPEIMEPYFNIHVAIGIMMTPMVLVIFFRWDELSSRIVIIAHSIAFIIFFLLAMGMEVFSYLGHNPPGTLMYKIFAHLGWSLFWVPIYKEIKKQHALHRKLESYSDYLKEK